MQAFSSTAGSRIGGAIPPAMMKKDSADRKEIELIHVPWDFSDVQILAGFSLLKTIEANKKKPEFPEVNVAGGNQDKATSLPSGVLAISFLYYMASRTLHPPKLVVEIVNSSSSSSSSAHPVLHCPLSIPGLFWMATKIE